MAAFCQVVSAISIHALRKESDLGNVVAGLRMLKFLSTLSARRATSHLSKFNTSKSISIHALRKESD